jgi:hypothetical protein
MRRLAWRTDIHRSFVIPGEMDAVCRTVLVDLA